MSRICVSGAKTNFKSHSGFTLIELLATFVLIAIIIPVAMRGISLSTRIASHSKKQIEAISLAETKLTEFLITENWLDGDQSGDFGDGWPAYRWNLVIEDWEEEETTKQLVLSVEWSESGLGRSVTLTTIVYTESG
jgi:prepilin-type N-terminal cleavage/methylation domain-containing protein